MEYTTVSLGPGAGFIAVGKSLQAISDLQSRLSHVQKEREQDYWKLREIETRYRALMEASSEAVALVRVTNLRIVEANAVATRALGLVPGGEFYPDMPERDRRAMLAMLELVRDEGPCAEHCASSFRRRPVEPQGQHDLERGRRVLPPANVAAARVGLARPRRGGARRGRRVCRRGFGAAHAGRLRHGRPPGLGETGERHVSRFRPGGRRKRGGRPEREALAQPARRRHRDDFELVRVTAAFGRSGRFSRASSGPAPKSRFPRSPIRSAIRNTSACSCATYAAGGRARTA